MNSLEAMKMLLQMTNLLICFHTDDIDFYMGITVYGIGT